jgi:hypothetical protein
METEIRSQIKGLQLVSLSVGSNSTTTGPGPVLATAQSVVDGQAYLGALNPKTGIIYINTDVVTNNSASISSFLKRSLKGNQITQSGYASYGLSLTIPGNLVGLGANTDYGIGLGALSRKFSEVLTFSANGQNVIGRKSVSMSGPAVGTGSISAN